MTDSLVTANVKLASSDWEMGFQLSVPEGPVATKELLPLAQNLSNAIGERKGVTGNGKVSGLES